MIALLTMYVPKWAPVTAPIYAVLEGLGIGAISFLTNERYRGLPLRRRWQRSQSPRCASRFSRRVPFGSFLDQGLLGFGINALAIGLAISCLFVDFADIESARRQRLSAKTEWYFAFSVLVT